MGPLSNAASWQSIPELNNPSGGWAVNELPEGIDLDTYAETIAHQSVTLYPEVQFVNGFCFLITRTALDRVGLLDEETYPRGYGEEDDFAIRASEAGLRHLIADDCYIFHAKSRSFTPEGRTKIVKESKKGIAKKHGPALMKSLIRTMESNEDLLRARTAAKLALRARNPPAVHERPSKPVKIGWFEPHLRQVGGVRRAIEMGNHLVAMGCDVSLITPDGERTNWLPIAAEVITNAEAESRKFDVLIVSDPDTMLAFEVHRARLRINYHLAPYMLYRPENDALNRYYALNSDCVHIANSQWTAEQAYSHANVEIAGVFPGGVNRRLFCPVRQEKRFDIVCYGSNRPHKGTETIMQASKLDASIEVLRLVDLQAPQEQLARHISSGRAFASACWHEGFNFCPLEAMACGVPVVMTDDGGSREYAQDGINSFSIRNYAGEQAEGIWVTHRTGGGSNESSLRRRPCR